VADNDCSAGERCNTANKCVVPCHRDADCNNPSLWCGAPIIASDVSLATCQQVTGITVSRAAVSRPSDIILAGSQNVSVASYEFEATGEAFHIRSLTLVNCIGFTNDDPGCSGIGAQFGTGIETVRIIYKNGSFNMVATGILSAGRVEFTGMDFIVGIGNSVNRTMPFSVVVDTVRMAYGGVSGAQFQLNVASFTAVGISSGIQIAGGTAPANEMTIRATKPTVFLDSGSPSGAAYSGFSEVLRYNMTADAAGYIGVNMVKFRLSSVDNAGTGWNKFRGFGTVGLTASSFRLYDVADQSQEITAGMWLLNATGAVANEGETIVFVRFFFDPRVVDISAGMGKTFLLKMDTSGVSTIPSQGDIVRVDITDIEWSDAGMAESIGSTYIKYLPLMGGTLIF